jgi:ATP-dependent DNA helicase PIF1
MRVHKLIQEGRNAEAQLAWSEFLLDVGEGVEGDTVKIDPDMVVTGGVEDLLADIFGKIKTDPAARTWEHLTSRAILTPKNADVDVINKTAMELFPGVVQTYLSRDSVTDDHQQAFPTEYLNGISASGLPEHCIQLKIGMPVMLLRNICPLWGLANGTRLIVTGLKPHSLVAVIMTGKCIGKTVFIPRIKIEVDDEKIACPFLRQQIPVRAAFGMTINKAQGQTLTKCGVFLPSPVFGHGQLYVALSRCGERAGVRIMVGRKDKPDERHGKYVLKNVVYREVLSDTPGRRSRAATTPANPPSSTDSPESEERTLRARTAPWNQPGGLPVSCADTNSAAPVEGVLPRPAGPASAGPPNAARISGAAPTRSRQPTCAEKGL